MANGAIESRLISSLHRGSKKGELDLAAKLKIQQKQNSLPKVQFTQPTLEIATDIDKLKSKYIVLTPKKQFQSSHKFQAKPQHVAQSKNTSNPNEAKQSISESPQPKKAQDGIPEAKRNFFPVEKIGLKWNQQQMKLLGGLCNLGNTCYLNSSLQCLMHTAPLVNILAQSQNHPATNGFCPLKALSRLIRTLQNVGPRSATRPQEIVQNLRKIASHFSYGRQECAHEFTRLFMDALLRSCTRMNGKVDKYEETTTIPHRVFGGWLRSRVSCSNCKHNSDTFESFLDINLEMKGCDSLQDCMRHFTMTEILDNGNMYKCDKCKKATRAAKRFTIHRPPNVLAISLKRFNMMGNKNGREIRFSSKLDISKYCSYSKMDNNYELYAILVHAGFTVNSGHYYSYCRTSKGTWSRFDDSCVTPTSLENVLRQQPYMLYYVRTDTPFWCKKRPNSSPVRSPVPAKVPAVSPVTPTNNQLPKNPFISTPSPSPKKGPLIGPQRPTTVVASVKVTKPDESKYEKQSPKPSQVQSTAKSPVTSPQPFKNKLFYNPGSNPKTDQNGNGKASSKTQNKHFQKSNSISSTIGMLKTQVKDSPSKIEKKRISGLVGYSSDESEDERPSSKNSNNSNSPKKNATPRKLNDSDELVKSFHERKDRIQENRKRKYNLGNGGSFWGLGKVNRWDGKANKLDERDHAASSASAKSLISSEQLDIDKGKTKKLKLEKNFQRSKSWSSVNHFQKAQSSQSVNR